MQVEPSWFERLLKVLDLQVVADVKPFHFTTQKPQSEAVYQVDSQIQGSIILKVFEFFRQVHLLLVSVNPVERNHILFDPELLGNRRNQLDWTVALAYFILKAGISGLEARVN